jgi:hypothetical protein
MGDWDYKPDLGKTATDNVDDVLETEEETPDFGFDLEPTDDEDEDAEGATEDSDDVDKVEKPPVADKTAANDAAIAESVLRHVGKDTLIRVKGVEKPIGSFAPAEIVNWLQKSMRADQTMQEAAAQRRQVEEERRKLEERSALLEKGAAMVSERLSGGQGQGQPQAGNVPDFLKPGQYDTEETTALKQFAAQQQQRLERLEGTFSQRQQEDKLRGIQHELEGLAKDYPLASRDEVLAVKLAHPEVSTEDLMRMAHDYYSGGEHIKSAMAANPTFKREYDAEVVKQYIARKNSAKKIAGQPAAANSSSSKVSEKGKIPIRNFDDAAKASYAYLKETKRLADED